MPCAAQYTVDKKWYRAKIIALPGKRMVEVFYVDYGNQELVAWNQIRRLQPRFLRIPAQVNILFRTLYVHWYNFHKQGIYVSLIRKNVVVKIYIIKLWEAPKY